MKNTFTYYPHEHLFEIHLGVAGQLGKTLVDIEGFDIASRYSCTWSKNGSGYAMACIRNKSVFLHTLLCSGTGGVVDHINMDKLDNRITNLRRTTQNKNIQRGRNNGLNTSGYIGVSWNKTSSLWYAYIRHKGRMKRLGSFFYKEDAARAYNDAAILLFGEQAKLNIVTEAHH